MTVDGLKVVARMVGVLSSAAPYQVSLNVSLPEGNRKEDRVFMPSLASGMRCQAYRDSSGWGTREGN